LRQGEAVLSLEKVVERERRACVPLQWGAMLYTREGEFALEKSVRASEKEHLLNHTKGKLSLLRRGCRLGLRVNPGCPPTSEEVDWEGAG